MRVASTLILTAVLLSAGAVAARAQQYPMLDRMAEKVVQKYQSSSCQQLMEQRAHRPTGQRAEMEARLVRMLHQDPRMLQEFLNRVAAPIANKLFECGLIP